MDKDIEAMIGAYPDSDVIDNLVFNMEGDTPLVGSEPNQFSIETHNEHKITFDGCEIDANNLSYAGVKMISKISPLLRKNGKVLIIGMEVYDEALVSSFSSIMCTINMYKIGSVIDALTEGSSIWSGVHVIEYYKLLNSIAREINNIIQHHRTHPDDIQSEIKSYLEYSIGLKSPSFNTEDMNTYIYANKMHSMNILEMMLYKCDRDWFVQYVTRIQESTPLMLICVFIPKAYITLSKISWHQMIYPVQYSTFSVDKLIYQLSGMIYGSII